MKVSELIDELEQLNPNMEVCVPGEYKRCKSIDVYFEVKEVWNGSGDRIKLVAMMYGDY